jgi:sulfate adenylyltransferase subunit 2
VAREIARVPQSAPSRGYLDWLESEAIYILREVAGECANPALLFIAREAIALPSVYFAHRRPIVRRKGLLVPVTPLTPPQAGEVIEDVSVRFRTVGDIPCTCPVASTAASADEIIIETALSRITEQGATRMDDQTSEASMERRKKEGYF